MPGSTKKIKRKAVRSGKLRIADHWNAISIIASSQANPLKAVAEFVENSIDARAKQIVIVINNGHRDSVYSGKQKGRKLRYICRLFCKELVRHNFPGLQTDELLERMIELSLYTEEHLR